MTVELELSAPLAKAYNSIAEIFGEEIPLTVNGKQLEFEFSLSGNGEFTPGVIEYHHKYDVLLMGVKVSPAFVPWRGCKMFFKCVNDHLDSLLEGERYDYAGYLRLYRNGNATAVASYEVPIHYGILEDEEYGRKTKRAFSRCLRVSSLLEPLFTYMWKEQVVPSAPELFHILNNRHMAWELAGFPQEDNKCVYLPKGYFGGVGKLLPQ